MLIQPNAQPEVSEMEKLFPGKPDEQVLGRAEEALRAHMIIGFEEALENGMPPMEALGHVLSWAASEMARINSGAAPFDQDRRHPA